MGVEYKWAVTPYLYFLVTQMRFHFAIFSGCKISENHKPCWNSSVPDTLQECYVRLRISESDLRNKMMIMNVTKYNSRQFKKKYCFHLIVYILDTPLHNIERKLSNITFMLLSWAFRNVNYGCALVSGFQSVNSWLIVLRKPRSLFAEFSMIFEMKLYTIISSFITNFIEFSQGQIFAQNEKSALDQFELTWVFNICFMVINQNVNYSPLTCGQFWNSCTTP